MTPRPSVLPNTFEVSVEHGEQRVTAQQIKCFTCSRENLIVSSRKGALPEDALMSIWKNRGWKVERRSGKHLCPACLEKPKPFNPPRKPEHEIIDGVRGVSTLVELGKPSTTEDILKRIDVVAKAQSEPKTRPVPPTPKPTTRLEDLKALTLELLKLEQDIETILLRHGHLEAIVSKLTDKE